MFVYWSKKEKWYRDMESVSSDFCENCNSKREHTYRLYEERRKHYSVLSGPIKRSVRVICQACKGESKPEKKHEKQQHIERRKEHKRTLGGFGLVWGAKK